MTPAALGEVWRDDDPALIPFSSGLERLPGAVTIDGADARFTDGASGAGADRYYRVRMAGCAG